MPEQNSLPNSYSDINKIDAHMHLNFGRNALPEAADPEGFSLVTVNTDVPFFPGVDRQRTFAIVAQKDFPGRFAFLTTFESLGFGNPGWIDRTIDQIRTGVDAGAVGVKIWKNFGMELRDQNGDCVMADHPALDPIYEFLVQEEIPLLAHLGEPKNCWLPLDQMTVLSDREYFSTHPRYHMYKSEVWPSYEEQLDSRDRILEKHPGLRYIGAHLASLEWSVDRLAGWLDKYPQCGVDLAERVCHLQHQASINPEKVRNFVDTYQDRIIYGSDHIDDGSESIKDTQSVIRRKWRSEFRFFSEKGIQKSNIVEKPFRGLGLGVDVLQKIFHDNAIAYFPRLKNIGF